MCVIRQYLHIYTNPGASTKIKFIPVVTWTFELLKTLIFPPVFTDHEAWKQMKEWVEYRWIRNDLREVYWWIMF